MIKMNLYVLTATRRGTDNLHLVSCSKLPYWKVGTEIEVDSILTEKGVAMALKLVRHQQCTNIKVLPVLIGEELPPAHVRKMRREQLIADRNLTDEEIELLQKRK